MALYHPIHFSDEFTVFDKQFKDTCCSSGQCDMFHERRPIDNSTDYKPPFFGEKKV